jgi:putative sterol carrier protein
MATIPSSASDLFDNILPASLAQNPAAASAVGAIFVFKITGEGGGEWTVDLASATPSVKKSVGASGDCNIEVPHSDFQDMLKDQTVGMKLFMAGKLRVTGNAMLAMKLQKIFTLGA